MSITVTSQDARYNTLKRSRNLRWPAQETDAVSSIELCETAEDAARALQKIIDAGVRPTIRSGGHCYEDFVVNNSGGTILDLSLLSVAHLPEDGKRYRISPGRQLGDVYLDLYKRYGVTIPAGSCYSVGAGGHICGGGYGLLSRLHGLTVDWLSAVDILTVDAHGKVILRRVDAKHDPDLFRACRGAGGGNFGVITGFLFDDLPPAPQEVVDAGISFSWDEMTESRFISIVNKYGGYLETQAKAPDTWGLFTMFGLTHKSAEHLSLSLQFCNPDGTCRDLSVVNEFLEIFRSCGGSSTAVMAPTRHAARESAGLLCPEMRPMTRRRYLEATASISGSGGIRAKYKSSHMKRNFTEAEARCIYKHLTMDVPGVDMRANYLAVDSYGGAVNRASLVEETASWQRSSIMKLQFESYWAHEEDDKARLQWVRDFYNDLYSDPGVSAEFAHTPYPGDRYEGCYINYPDCDMLAHSFWPQLYYGDQGLYPFLQAVKRKYDPNNIFHHAMSVRA